MPGRSSTVTPIALASPPALNYHSYPLGPLCGFAMNFFLLGPLHKIAP